MLQSDCCCFCCLLLHVVVVVVVHVVVVLFVVVVHILCSVVINICSLGDSLRLLSSFCEWGGLGFAK